MRNAEDNMRKKPKKENSRESLNRKRRRYPPSLRLHQHLLRPQELPHPLRPTHRHPGHPTRNHRTIPHRRPDPPMLRLPQQRNPIPQRNHLPRQPALPPHPRCIKQKQRPSERCLCTYYCFMSIWLQIFSRNLFLFLKA